MSKLLVIIASGKEAKEEAVAGLLFAANSMKFGWAEKVEIVFFGPSQDLLAEDELVISQLGEIVNRLIDEGFAPMGFFLIT